MRILYNIHRSALTFNTKDYPLFLLEDILEISVKKSKEIILKVIQYEDLHINIGNKNSPTLFFDILYYTIIIYEDSVDGFRLGSFLHSLQEPQEKYVELLMFISNL